MKGSSMSTSALNIVPLNQTETLPNIDIPCNSAALGPGATPRPRKIAVFGAPLNYNGRIIASRTLEV